MQNKIWVLEQLRRDDPRHFLDLLVFKTFAGDIQTIRYNNNNVYLISEEQYQKLVNLI